MIGLYADRHWKGVREIVPFLFQRFNTKMRISFIPSFTVKIMIRNVLIH